MTLVASRYADPRGAALRSLRDDATVEVRYDGNGALSVYETMQPNVVLLDIGLPGTRGYDVAQQLRDAAGVETGLQ